MNSVLNKFISLGVSALLIQTAVFALDSEFRNTLVKVELSKISDSTYNVDLYTQKKYSEPVKIIKKSDLNYYILLPETKNDMTNTAMNSEDIRNITADLYPYAGQDVNNGYTKVNINTTKPINFNVNVKTVTQAAAKISQDTQEVDLKEKIALEEEKQTFNSETEKKNSQSPVSKALKVKEKIKNFKKETKLKIAPVLKVDTVEDYRQEQVEYYNSQEAFYSEDNTKEIISAEELAELEKIAHDRNSNFDSEDMKYEAMAFKDKLVKIAHKFNLRLRVFLIILFLPFAFAFGFLFFIIKKVCSKKRRKTSKIGLCDFKQEEQKDEEKPKNDGQYFIFDKNIKQTGFCDPATSAIKKNYELSSYEPDLKKNYKKVDNQADTLLKKNSEYDIIQKILKEDSFIEISSNVQNKQIQTQIEPKKTTNKAIQPQIQKTPQPKAEVKKQEKQIQPPSVLSSVEIAPERGFMCVSYNDNINLMGYIFDDVFPLYNFKQPKLENYDIKYRLSEKEGQEARFIVKIADVKMLVYSSKTTMKMEVLL